MHILRKIGLWVTSAIFRFLLLTTAIVGTIVMILGTPTHIKDILRDSNVYGTFVDGVISEARKHPETQSDSSLPIDDPVFQKAIKDAFTPEFLQTTTENVVDGTYHWLTGKVEQPDFKIDITAQKQQFANAIGDYAVVKLNALPVCTKQQLLQLQAAGDLDPFKATCRPAGLDVTAQKQKVINDLSTNKDFLSKTVITADSLSKDQKGENFFQEQSAIPKAYGLMSFSPAILAVILLLLAAAIIYLQNTRRRGFRSVGFILAETGVFLGIVSFLSALFYRSASKPGGVVNKALGESSFQQTISKVLGSFMQLFNSWLVWFGLIYAVLGASILAVLYFTRNRNKPKTSPENEPEIHKSPVEGDNSKVPKEPQKPSDRPKPTT